MFWDIALTYDPQARACDLALGEDCDLVIDDTPATAMLLSLGLDRRAAPDDQLPAGRSAFLAPASFSERRGCAGDALDAYGDLTGCRLWLLDRAKQTETTRQLAIFYASEGLSWVLSETGVAATIEAEWRGRGMLTLRAVVDDTALAIAQRLEA